MIRSAPFLGWTLVTLVSIGCGQSKSAGVSDPCGTYFDALVQANANCGRPAPGGDVYMRARTRFQTECKLGLAAPGTGATADAMTKCAATFASKPCGAMFSDPACQAAPGKLPDNSPCLSSEQCASGRCPQTYAVGDGGIVTSVSTCGVCTPTIAVGDACDPQGAVQCISGVLWCRANVCMAVVLGDLTADCANGLDCKSGACNGGECYAPASVGGVCKPGEECVGGATCVDGTCTALVGEGKACTRNGVCAASLVCDLSSGLCKKAVFVAAGEACDEVNRCAVGGCMLTSETAGTCPAVIADGAPCDETSLSATCDFSASCINGTCSIADAAMCK